MFSKGRAREIVIHSLSHGEKSALDVFGISESTLKRYKRSIRDEAGASLNLLSDIHNKFSAQELKAIVRGAGLGVVAPPKIQIDFKGDLLKLGFITDLHIGSVYYKPEFLSSALAEFAKEKVDFVVIAGDITEGMSTRPGHVYELSHIGFDAQKTYAISELARWGGTIYAIDGNHDRWYLKANGALIVKDICEALPDAHFLGHDEGDIGINDISIKLWHGEDGASYAISYRIQKIIESLSGGEKPNILLLGHDHKQSYFFERNIHAIGGGCMSTQSKWMRSKRLAAHPGFWMLAITIRDGGVAKLSTTWYPFYA